MCECAGCVHHAGPCSAAAAPGFVPGNATPRCDDCACAAFWGAASATDAAVTGDLTSRELKDDIAGSRDFLRGVAPARRGVAVDLGAGTGRVAAELLGGYSTVHLVEPSPNLLAAAVDKVVALTIHT